VNPNATWSGLSAALTTATFHAPNNLYYHRVVSLIKPVQRYFWKQSATHLQAVDAEYHLFSFYFN